MINPFPYIYYQLYLLQLEEYNVGRYKSLMRKTGGKPTQNLRKKIQWTGKIILIFFLALLLQLLLIGLFSYFVYKFSHWIVAAVVFIVLLVQTSRIFHLFVSLAVVIITPLDTYLKKRLVGQAKNKVKQYPDLKIIGIAGSYGKTTMKEVLSGLLSQKYVVLKTPESVNTPVGISRLIMKKLNPETEVFIVEMGEYYKGDVAALCEITPPDIAIITGINEAHLERLQNLETTTETIFEIVERSKPDALVMLNGDDATVVENQGRFSRNREALVYTTHPKKDLIIKNRTFREDTPALSFDLYEKELFIGSFTIPVLGEYIIGDIVGAIQIAQKLGLSVTQISQGISQIKPVPHRLQSIYNEKTDVLVIDDSYNGNPDGVREAINVLRQFKKRRRLYLTPGLVETGPKNEEIHYNIGKQLRPVADMVILIRNSATPHIEKGLLDNGFGRGGIVWFESTKEAHEGLKHIMKKNDVILFQNDWPDNYL